MFSKNMYVHNRFLFLTFTTLGLLHYFHFFKRTRITFIDYSLNSFSSVRIHHTTNQPWLVFYLLQHVHCLI